MSGNLENSAAATGLEKVSFHSNPKEGQGKECSNYCTIILISHTSKVMFKILQARLQQYMNCEFPDIQAGFTKGRGTRDQIANICWITEKAREFQKTSTSASLTKLKPLTEWITKNCGKFWKRREYKATLPDSWEICMQVKKQQVRTGHGRMNWFQIGKGVCQGCIFSPCLFNLYAEYIMRNTGLESRLLGEISITSDMQMTLNLWHKVKN